MWYGLGMSLQIVIEKGIKSNIDYLIVIDELFIQLSNIYIFRLFEIVKSCMGYQYAVRISQMEKDTYPLILTLIRSRGSLDLASVIEGKNTPSEVMIELIQAHESFEQQLQRDAEEEIISRGKVSSFTKAKKVTKPKIVIFRKRSGLKK